MIVMEPGFTSFKFQCPCISGIQKEIDGVETTRTDLIEMAVAYVR